MPWTPRATVAAIVERQGRFLFVLERTEAGLVINQPAGHLEAGETLIEAVRREVLEETAHPFQPQGLVGIYRLPLSEELTYLRFCFFGAVEPPQPRPLDPEILDTLWLTPEEVQTGRYTQRSPLVWQCLRDYLGGSRHPLDLLHEID